MKNVSAQLSKFLAISFFDRKRESRSLLHIILMVLISIIMSSPGMTQSVAPTWEWATHQGGTQYNSGVQMAVDTSGNSYVTGFFQDTVVFGSQTFICNGEYDIFLAKYDVLGNVLWARQMGGPNQDFGNGIAVDNSGNVYVTGYFTNSMLINGQNITGKGLRDVFTVKYRSNGDFVWVIHAGGTSFYEANSIGVSINGKVTITGSFYDTMNFDDSSISLTSAGNRDIFIAQYDSLGTIQWAKSAGGLYDDIGYGISMDNLGNCYGAGYFYDLANFGSIALQANGYNSDICIYKLDAQGIWQWAKSFGSNMPDMAWDIAADGAGSTYTTGIFYGPSITVGKDVLTTHGYYDPLIIKLNANGNPQWAREGGSAGWDYGRAVAVDRDGNSYMAGNYELTAAFGDTTLTVVGNTDAFVVKYDPNGNVQWAESAGGPSTDIAEGVAADKNGNVYATGYFYQHCSFGDTTIYTTGDQDIFVAKLKPPIPAYLTVTGEIVSGQTQCYDATNTITVAGNGNSFIVNGDSRATFIAGQKISFMPGTRVLETGYLFGYISTDSYCNFTPPALPAVAAGEEETPFSFGQASFTIFPNPTNDNFTIVQKGDKEYSNVTIEVYGILGDKVLFSHMVGEKKHEFVTSALPAGLYFVKVVADDYTESIKLIITK